MWGGGGGGGGSGEGRWGGGRGERGGGLTGIGWYILAVGKDNRRREYMLGINNGSLEVAKLRGFCCANIGMQRIRKQIANKEIFPWAIIKLSV